MKINDLNKLEDKISSELSWRKKELSSLKLDIEASQNESFDKQNRFIRMAISMLYAHWEGAIKSLAEKVFAKLEEQYKIPYKDVIKTRSNLKMDVFDEIVAVLALDSKEYQTKKIFIDVKLLANRNRIAHGERFEALEGVTTVPEYLELHKEVLALIDKFSEDIKKAATNQAFKK